jgi:hypothetical protein
MTDESESAATGEQLLFKSYCCQLHYKAHLHTLVCLITSASACPASFNCLYKSISHHLLHHTPYCAATAAPLLHWVEALTMTATDRQLQCWCSCDSSTAR